jgi:hypothetical protein
MTDQSQPNASPQSQQVAPATPQAETPPATIPLRKSGLQERSKNNRQVYRTVSRSASTQALASQAKPAQSSAPAPAPTAESSAEASSSQADAKDAPEASQGQEQPHAETSADASADAKAEPEAPKLSDKEEAERRTKLMKLEQRQAQEKVELAKARAEIQKTQGEIATLQKEHASDPIGTVNKYLGSHLKQAFKKDPLGSLAKLGISADDIAGVIFNTKPEPKEALAKAEADPELEAIRRRQDEIEASQKADRQRAINNQVSNFKANVIGPLITDPNRYQLLKADQGDNAVHEVWSYMQLKFKQLSDKYGGDKNVPQDQYPTAQTAADDIEAYLKSRADLYNRALVDPTKNTQATSKETSAKPAPSSQKPAPSVKPKKPFSHHEVASRTKPTYSIRQPR